MCDEIMPSFESADKTTAPAPSPNKTHVDLSFQSKILEYFSIVEKSISNKYQKDLIILKKALYQINVNNKEEGNKLLEKLIDNNSSLKTIAQEILAD